MSVVMKLPRAKGLMVTNPLHTEQRPTLKSSQCSYSQAQTICCHNMLLPQLSLRSEAVLAAG